MDTNERFRIVPFEEQYYDQLKQLVYTGWNANHVLLKSDALMKWHFTGYGQKKGMHFPLLFDGEKMIGYRMMTPIEMMVSDSNGNHTVIPLSASSLYYVDKEYRGMKLGVKLENSVIDLYGGYFTIAANPVTAVPILKRSGCKMIDTMLRWFRPLAEDMKPIVISDCGHKWNMIKPRIIQPCDIEAKELAKIWENSVSGKNITALNRSEDFWQWRYIDDPIYKYCFFRNEGGVVIARVCSLFNEQKSVIDQKVIRILEVIPTNQNVWDGKGSPMLSSLLDGVCGWGQAQGCVAAEFYFTSHRFDALMEDAYFEEINTEEPLCNSIMSYYEPMSVGHRLSNVGIMSTKVPVDFDFENSYFTLSDADQDRPNIII